MRHRQNRWASSRRPGGASHAGLRCRLQCDRRCLPTGWHNPLCSPPSSTGSPVSTSLAPRPSGARASHTPLRRQPRPMWASRHSSSRWVPPRFASEMPSLGPSCRMRSSACCRADTGAVARRRTSTGISIRVRLDVERPVRHQQALLHEAWRLRVRPAVDPIGEVESARCVHRCTLQPPECAHVQ